MNFILKEMCREVLDGNINSEKFAGLLIESGINPEGVEWDIASKLLDKSDEMRLKVERLGQTLN